MCKDILEPYRSKYSLLERTSHQSSVVYLSHPAWKDLFPGFSLLFHGFPKGFSMGFPLADRPVRPHGRYFKSPFDPLDLRDMQLRQNISRVMVKDETWPPDLGTVGTVGGGSGSGIPLRLGFYMMIDGRPNSSRPIYFLPKGHVFGEISGSLVLWI